MTKKAPSLLLDDPRPNDPMPYDMSRADELTRLLSELEGYMRVSLRNGTDTEGRAHAYAALVTINHRRHHIHHYIVEALAEDADRREASREARMASVGFGIGPRCPDDMRAATEAAASDPDAERCAAS